MDCLTEKCDGLLKEFCTISCGKIRCKMPSDMVSLAVSTGFGVSVLVGIVSGVCYVLAHGFHTNKSGRRGKISSKWNCNVCGADLSSIHGILEGERVVTCTKCQANVCKARCSKLSLESVWICQKCSMETSWFQGIMRSLQLSGKDYNIPNMDLGNNKALEFSRKMKKEEVREFIEKLVNILLGENVDDARITKLYSDKQYLPISGQSPCTAHAALKELIQRLLQEASNLPRLEKTPEKPTEPSKTDDTGGTYEDLLATAIINKIITTCQNNLPSSSANSVSSRLSTSSRHIEEKEYFFGEETLDNKWKTTDLDSTSVSSLEEWIQSETSFGSRKYVDKVTLTIKQDIEEEYQSDYENDDDADYLNASAQEEREDVNWLLRKRHFNGTASPVPVPMLVPDPATEAKVLIGDKEVADTSDLSDIGSDCEDMEPVLGRHSLLIESKTIIGGKNTVEIKDMRDHESLSSSDSGVKEVDGSHMKTFDRSSKSVDDEKIDLEYASLLSVYSNTEKEAEYTEKYASLPRTILVTPSPVTTYTTNLIDHKEAEEVSKGTETKTEDICQEPNKVNKTKEGEEDVDFPGMYSRREKEKWKQAVELKHNPYSKESLEKRIKRSRSGVSSMFGSDYYARQASSPSGGKLESSENWSIFLSKDAENEDFHKAVPAVVQSDEEVFSNSNEGSKCEKNSISSERLLSELTSDSDLSYINFYSVENAQVTRKSNLTSTPKQNRKDTKFSYESEEERIDVVTKETPKPKPRHFVTKHNISPEKISNQRTLQGLTRRIRSESDLLDDSFDKTPTVVHRKKDNTLISKIYLNPQVRNYRDHLPVEETSIRPVFKQHISVDLSAPTVRKASLTSDDESGKTGKMSFFSSEEDLLSLYSNSNRDTVPKNVTKPEHLSRKKYSLSSEDGLSETSHRSKPLSTRNMIYSSSEDLLSIDDVETIPKRKDNTLITKIYLDPKVRSFALKNREQVPHPTINTSVKNNSDKDVSYKKTERPSTLLLKDTTTVLKDSEEDGKVREKETPDSDIDGLVKKRLVHSLRNQFSMPHSDVPIRKNSLENGDSLQVSVKDLKKRFENEEVRNRVISSLTARSLSKQMKESLKN